ncbi:MAG TPA: hypothetical protein PLO41_23080 [Rubrivivax sp.]|nr:hypothetical protein [Rubrivivax sp.]
MGARWGRGWRAGGLAVVALLLAACGGDDEQLSLKAAVGERIFHDTALSASGRQS